MEITNISSQKVASGDNVIFTTVRVCGNCSTIFQADSGLVTLRGLANGQHRARFRVKFTGNLKADSSETIEGVTLLSLTVAKTGEPIQASNMIVTVGDTTSTYNVSTEILVDVPTCCCQNISIKNISSITVDVLNANLIVERVA
jgi:hypothetical protein